MALLPIIIVPDPVLKQIAQPIEAITAAVQKQAQDKIGRAHV